MSEQKEKKKLPIPGQRIVRSSVAVACCFIIYYLRGQQGIPFYSALAVLQCIQPYTDSTKNMGKKRTTGTLIGAFWGLVMLLILIAVSGGKMEDMHVSILQYLLISIFTGIVLYSTVLLDCTNSSYFSCVVFLSITVNHITDENPFLFVLNRVVDTMIGVVLAILINKIHMPRKKQKDILFVSGVDDTILTKQMTLTSYSKVELNRLIDDGMKFTISSRRTPASIREALPGVHIKCPVIAMDGAVLYDMNENAYLQKYAIPKEQAAFMNDLLKKYDIAYFANTVVDDLLVIYYEDLKNISMKGVYERRRKSLYRNYVKTNQPVCENIVYFFGVDTMEKLEAFCQALEEADEAGDFRFVLSKSQYVEGYGNVKIYHKDATRENMLENLKEYLGVEKTMTFGSIPGRYDIFVEDSNGDVMVKELKKQFGPISLRVLLKDET